MASVICGLYTGGETIDHCGIEPHHTSPPRRVEEYAEFCVAMVRRYAPLAAVTKIGPRDQYPERLPL